MKLTIPSAEIFVPDGKPIEEALARTTHMCVAAHQDDIEIMATHGILECFGLEDKWFTGVVVTNGSGSPRDGIYANYTDDEMQRVRRQEQKKAAFVGEYAAQGLLDFPSSAVKEPGNRAVIEDIKTLLMAARPEIVYTHNLADKHDTHVGVALKVVQAIREMPADMRPKVLWGGEVWRCLDWLNDADKVLLDCSSHENLAAALLGVHDSQIAGGKRYDLAVQGRRRSNATFFESHGVDDTTSQNFGMDLTPLIQDLDLSPQELVATLIKRFSDEVMARIAKVG